MAGWEDVRAASTSEQSTTSIRVAAAADAVAIVALVESAYRGERSRTGWTTEADLLDGQRTDLAEVGAALGDGAVTVLVAESDDRTLVGCCQVRHVPTGPAYFGSFAVDPDWQGRGLGRVLLVEAERVAHQILGASVMEMTVIGQRVELIDWYRRRGYRPTGERRPFPYGDQRAGLPRREDLEFVVLDKRLP